MTKSELIDRVARRQPCLTHRDVEVAVKSILELMAATLADGGRVEVRGFGSFFLHYRQRRTGRNPRTGEPVRLPAKHVPRFRPGKALRERIERGRAAGRPGAPSARSAGDGLA